MPRPPPYSSKAVIAAKNTAGLMTGWATGRTERRWASADRVSAVQAEFEVSGNATALRLTRQTDHMF